MFIRADCPGVPSWHPAVGRFPEGCGELGRAQHTSVPSSRCHSATAIGLSPSAKTTGEERALLFLPPLLTQLGGLELGEVSPPEGQEPPRTRFVAQAALEEAKLLRPPRTGLLGAARASLGLCEVAIREDVTPAAPAGSPQSRQPQEELFWDDGDVQPRSRGCRRRAAQTEPGRAAARSSRTCPDPSQGCSYDPRGFAPGAPRTHEPLAFTFSCAVVSSRLGWTRHDAGRDRPGGQALRLGQPRATVFNTKAPNPPLSISVQESAALAFADVQCGYFIAIYSKHPDQRCNRITESQNHRITE